MRCRTHVLQSMGPQAYFKVKVDRVEGPDHSPFTNMK
jgi:hypothetical protein